MTIKAAILLYLSQQGYGATINMLHGAVETAIGRNLPESSVRGRLNELTYAGVLKRKWADGEPGQLYVKVA